MKYLTLLFITLSFISCFQTSKNSIETINDRMTSFVPKDSGTKYIVYNDSLNNNHNYLEKQANDVLFNLKEPVLNNYTGKGDFLRFIWLRAFENPVVIRVNKFDDTIYANIKELKIKSSGDKPAEIKKDTIVVITQNDWQNFLSPIRQNNFWNLPYNKTSLNKDGTTWFLECRTNNQYHVIQRWDDGYLSSKELNDYLSSLIDFANKFIHLKSER
jgi:hypothetical protein